MRNDRIILGGLYGASYLAPIEVSVSEPHIPLLNVNYTHIYQGCDQ